SAKASAVSGVVSAGLSTTVLPQARAGAIFQASISSGKFHGMTWPATPRGRGAGPEPAYSRLSAQPAREKQCAATSGAATPRAQRDAQAGGRADRLAVVQRLEHGELARPLLDYPGDAEQVLGPLPARHGRPGVLVGLARGGHGPVHVGGAGLGHLGQDLLGGR